MIIKANNGCIIFEDGSLNIKDCVKAAIIQKINLSKANLYRANLSGSDLYGANLSGANLSGANLKEAFLFRANFYKTNLFGANLKEAFLPEANLSGADLSGANLSGANLFGADLSGANIDYASWPLCCGTIDVKIDERIAKQLAMHTFAVILDKWPGGLTKEQKTWINECHRIIDGSFKKF